MASSGCALLLTLVLGITWAQAPHIRGGAQWLLGAALVACGTGLNSLQGILPGAGVIVLSTSMICAGLGLIWLGSRYYRGGSGGLPVVAVVCVTYFTLAFAFTVISQQMALRQLSFSVVCAFFSVLAVIELLSEGPYRAQRARQVAACCMAAGALMFLVRSFIALSGNAHSIVQPTPVNFATFALGGLIQAALLVSLNGLMTSSLVAELKRFADTDFLTGVMNRQGFMRTAGAWLESYGGERLFALRMDLDELRKFNDAGGHELGDQLLRVAARTARELLPAHAMLARWGGDEFMAFIPGVAATQRFEVEYPMAFTVAARGLAALGKPGTPLSRMQPGVTLRKSEFQGSVKETFGATTFPPAPSASARPVPFGARSS